MSKEINLLSKETSVKYLKNLSEIGIRYNKDKLKEKERDLGNLLLILFGLFFGLFASVGANAYIIILNNKGFPMDIVLLIVGIILLIMILCFIFTLMPIIQDKKKTKNDLRIYEDLGKDSESLVEMFSDRITNDRKN